MDFGVAADFLEDHDFPEDVVKAIRALDGGENPTVTLTLVNQLYCGLRENHRYSDIAHRHEDAMHRAVLKAIADGTCRDPQACAQEAVKSFELKFTRDYGHEV